MESEYFWYLHTRRGNDKYEIRWSFKIWMPAPLLNKTRLISGFLNDAVREKHIELLKIKGSLPQVGAEVEPTKMARMRMLGVAFDGLKKLCGSSNFNAHFPDPQFIEVIDKDSGAPYTVVRITDSMDVQWENLTRCGLGALDGPVVMAKGRESRRR